MCEVLIHSVYTERIESGGINSCPNRISELVFSLTYCHNSLPSQLLYFLITLLSSLMHFSFIRKQRTD
uniref:Uncharacterized protein n=1 Tax=Octopus bimaculoides TaxID=37653 RepID=A0A0L8FSM3_OCTBM